MLDSLEAGKPITDCREVDLPETIKTFRWFAEAADKMYDAIAPTGPEALGLIVREPIGVVGAVLPWNFPIMMAAWKAAPALAAGNSMVIKPAELTSLSTIRMAELAAEAGLPDGVFNVVPGPRRDGRPGARAPHGRRHGVVHGLDRGRPPTSCATRAESNLKRIVLECGGKSPQIVMADAPDLDIVAEQVVHRRLHEHGRELHVRLAAHRPSRSSATTLARAG